MHVYIFWQKAILKIFRKYHDQYILTKKYFLSLQFEFWFWNQFWKKFSSKSQNALIGVYTPINRKNKNIG